MRVGVSVVSAPHQVPGRICAGAPGDLVLGRVSIQGSVWNSWCCSMRKCVCDKSSRPSCLPAPPADERRNAPPWGHATIGSGASFVVGKQPDALIRALLAHVPGLRRYAAALAGNAADADDLVQDCIERALVRQDTLREPESLGRWLKTILHNLYIPSCGAAALRACRSRTSPRTWR